MGNNVGVEDSSKKYSSDILSNYDSKSGEDASGEESPEGNLSQNNNSLNENDNQNLGIDISDILTNSF